MESARAHAKAVKIEQIDAPTPVDESPLPRSITPRATFLAPTPSQLERNPSSSTIPALPTLDKILSRLSLKGDDDAVKIKLADVNPFSAVGIVLRQKHNIVATLVSGLLFACQYAIAYVLSLATLRYIGLTCVRSDTPSRSASQRRRTITRQFKSASFCFRSEWGISSVVSVVGSTRMWY